MSPGAPKSGPSGQPRAAPIRAGLSTEAFKQAVVDNLMYRQARYPAIATTQNWYIALAHSVRDRMLERWVNTVMAYAARDVKVACYFSAEFLIGPQLGNNLMCLEIEDAARAAITELGQDLDALVAFEEEPGLGNGGLGRLAACYLDSLAALELPAMGYGIRYEFGIFTQEIRDGWQVETSDKWLRYGNPWEITRPEVGWYVSFGGRTERFTDSDGQARVRWLPASRVKGIACDLPVPDYGINTCTTLRLWRSEAVESFDFGEFNVGDYYGAVREKVISETLSKVLYPNDEAPAGKRLRLAQQYFFVSCSLQDMLRLLEMKGATVQQLPDLFTQRSRSRSSCVCSSTSMASSGTRPGSSRSERWRTRITRCCPKRSKPGVCRCSRSCCRGRSRSFTRSTAAFSTACAAPFRATTPESRAYR